MKKNEADQIVVYQPDETMRLDVRLDGKVYQVDFYNMGRMTASSSVTTRFGFADHRSRTQGDECLFLSR